MWSCRGCRRCRERSSRRVRVGCVGKRGSGERVENKIKRVECKIWKV